MRMSVFTACAAAALIGGCSSIPGQPEPTPRVQLYLDHAGDPVDSFTLLGRLNGWNPLGRNKLVIFSGVNQAHLISVDNTCLNLEFASRIGISTSMGNRINQGFDYIRFDDGFQGQRCRITEIRPVDRSGFERDNPAAS